MRPGRRSHCGFGLVFSESRECKGAFLNKPQSINESDLSSRVAFLITGLEREKKKTNKKRLQITWLLYLTGK